MSIYIIANDSWLSLLMDDNEYEISEKEDADKGRRLNDPCSIELESDTLIWIHLIYIHTHIQIKIVVYVYVCAIIQRYTF